MLCEIRKCLITPYYFSDSNKNSTDAHVEKEIKKGLRYATDMEDGLFGNIIKRERPNDK